MKKLMMIAILIAGLFLVGCGYSGGAYDDTKNTMKMADKLQANQATPIDIEYSLERYNLTKRAYWVNGQREKARMLPSPISDVPLGYVVLLTNNGGVVGKFVVEGKVSSLNSYLTPDSELYGLGGSGINKWLADVDGSYGTNDDGIFFFTPDGKYIEWTGTYLYSDIPFDVDNPIIKVHT